MTRFPFAAVMFVAMLPLTASAQSADETTQPPPSPPPINQGPMVVERIHSGFMFAPEVKITEFDHQTSGLVGGSAGYVAEEAFFFGGAGYWMPNGSNGRELGYGGFVMQWFLLGGDHAGVSAKVLLGGGGATVLQTVTQYVPLPGPRELDRLTPAQISDLNRARAVTTTVRVHDHFLVAEPEVNANIAFAKRVRLTLGVGYRFTGDGWWYYYGGFNNHERISGVVGSVGVQIGM